MWSDDRAQAMVEFALALPLVLVATFYAFALLDAATTQEAVAGGARRAALALAGSNDDAQARGAAQQTGWLRGQAVSVTITPDGTRKRCAGTLVAITVTATGHLPFLLPVATTWSATQPGTIENPGVQAATCP